MNTPAHPKTRRSGSALLLLVLCVLVYALAVAGYAVWSYREHKKALLGEIDSGLLQAARSLKYLLAADFHDRALAPDSIGRDEELRNRKLVTDFGVESGFKWVQTIVEKDGRFYFSAPSVSAEEARERESWYFYPYEDIPAEFVQGFQNNQTVFLEFTDQWGTYRSVALPETSPGGRRYIAEADREKVVRPFTRLDDSRSRDTGGFGLGLAIVGRVAARHHGELRIGRATLGGARLEMHWPLAAS